MPGMFDELVGRLMGNRARARMQAAMLGGDVELPQWMIPASQAGKHLLYFPQNAPGGERLFYYPPAVDPSGTSWRIVGSEQEAQDARDVGQRPLLWRGEGDPTVEAIRGLVAPPMSGGGLTQEDLDAMAALLPGGRTIAPVLINAPGDPQNWSLEDQIAHGAIIDRYGGGR